MDQSRKLPTIQQILDERNAKYLPPSPFSKEEIELAKHAEIEARRAAKADAYWIPEQADFFVPEQYRDLGEKIWLAEIRAAAKAVMLKRKFHSGNLQITVQRPLNAPLRDLQPYARAALEALQPKFFKHLCTFGITGRAGSADKGKVGMYCHLTEMQPKAVKAAMVADKYRGPFMVRADTMKVNDPRGYANPCLYEAKITPSGNTAKWCRTHECWGQHCDEKADKDYQYQAALKRKAMLQQAEEKLAAEIKADIAEIDRVCEAQLRAKTSP